MFTLQRLSYECSITSTAWHIAYKVYMNVWAFPFFTCITYKSNANHTSFRHHSLYIKRSHIHTAGKWVNTIVSGNGFHCFILSTDESTEGGNPYNTIKQVILALHSQNIRQVMTWEVTDFFFFFLRRYLSGQSLFSVHVWRNRAQSYLFL